MPLFTSPSHHTVCRRSTWFQFVAHRSTWFPFVAHRSTFAYLDSFLPLSLFFFTYDLPLSLCSFVSDSTAAVICCFTLILNSTLYHISICTRVFFFFCFISLPSTSLLSKYFSILPTFLNWGLWTSNERNHVSMVDDNKLRFNLVLLVLYDCSTVCSASWYSRHYGGCFCVALKILFSFSLKFLKVAGWFNEAFFWGCL